MKTDQENCFSYYPWINNNNWFLSDIFFQKKNSKITLRVYNKENFLGKIKSSVLGRPSLVIYSIVDKPPV